MRTSEIVKRPVSTLAGDDIAQIGVVVFEPESSDQGGPQ